MWPRFVVTGGVTGAPGVLVASLEAELAVLRPETRSDGPGRSGN